MPIANVDSVAGEKGNGSDYELMLYRAKNVSEHFDIAAVRYLCCFLQNDGS